MDYSLLVGIRRLSLEEAHAQIRAPVPAKGDAFVEPILTEVSGEVWVYYVGIIDFLQMWTGGKQVAHIIKDCFAPHPISTLAPDPYAKQFLAFFAKKLKDDGNVRGRLFSVPLSTQRSRSGGCGPLSETWRRRSDRTASAVRCRTQDVELVGAASSLLAKHTAGVNGGGQAAAGAGAGNADPAAAAAAAGRSDDDDEMEEAEDDFMPLPSLAARCSG